MENVLLGVRHVVVYMDDILLTRTNDRYHLSNPRAVLIKPEKTSLKLKREKCVFFVPSVEYLGRIISKNELVPGPRKAAAVLNAPAPTDEKQLQSYAGFVHFYRRFGEVRCKHTESLQAASASPHASQ